MKSSITILFFFILLMAGCAHEIRLVILKEAPAPDNRVLLAAKNAINEYHDSLQWKDQCSIKINDVKGVIETNWHPVHKGEVK